MCCRISYNRTYGSRAISRNTLTTVQNYGTSGGVRISSFPVVWRPDTHVTTKFKTQNKWFYVPALYYAVPVLVLVLVPVFVVPYGMICMHININPSINRRYDYVRYVPYGSQQFGAIKIIKRYFVLWHGSSPRLHVEGEYEYS